MSASLSSSQPASRCPTSGFPTSNQRHGRQRQKQRPVQTYEAAAAPPVSSSLTAAVTPTAVVAARALAQRRWRWRWRRQRILRGGGELSVPWFYLPFLSTEDLFLIALPFIFLFVFLLLVLFLYEAPPPRPLLWPRALLLLIVFVLSNDLFSVLVVACRRPLWPEGVFCPSLRLVQKLRSFAPRTQIERLRERPR